MKPGMRVYGTIVSRTLNNIVAYANQIYDENKELFQSDINSGLQTDIAVIKSNVTQLNEKITQEINDRLSGDTVLLNAIDLLNANSSTQGSVQYWIKQAIDAVVADAPEAFDTLKEIADWIAQDEHGIAALINRVAANEEAISSLRTTVNSIRDTYVAKADLSTEVESAIKTGLNIQSYSEIALDSDFKTINGNSIIGTGDIVISGGGDYLPLTGGNLDGNLSIYDTMNIYSSSIEWNDDGDYSRIAFDQDGITITAHGTGYVIANEFIKDGGTSAQFLKADGSVDSTEYLTSGDLSNYLDTTSEVGRTISGALILNGGATIPSSEKLDVLGNVESVNGFKKKGSSDDYVLLAGGGTKALSEIGPSEFNCVTLDSKQTITGEKWFSGDVRFLDASSVTVYNNIKVGEGTSYTSIMPWRIELSHIISPSPQRTAETILDAEGITSPKFIVEGGTSAQFLKADGSVDENAYNPTNNFKTINGNSIIGTGNIVIEGGGGTVSQIKVGNTPYNPTDGVISLPAYPTSLPASDVYSWAKASSKPGYSLDEISDGSNRKLSNYLPLTGGIMTGTLTVNNGFIANTIQSDGVITAGGDVTATGFKKRGGQANQFLKADGSVDSNSYALASSLGSYLPLSGGSLTGNLDLGGNTLEMANGDYSSSLSSSSLTFAHTEGQASIRLSTTDKFLSLTGAKILLNGVDSSTFLTSSSLNGYATQSWVQQQGYVSSSALNSYLPLSGGTITGNLTVNGSTILQNGYLKIYSPVGSQNATYFEFTDSQDVYFYNGGEYFFNATVNAPAFNNTSDLRKKTITGDVPMNLYNVANAPLFKFTWNNEKKYSGQHIGSAAQYWQTVLPELVSIGRDADMTLAMQYDVIALASAITVAKTAVDHEARIRQLEEKMK